MTDAGHGLPGGVATRRIMLVGPGFHFMSGISVYTCRLANELAEHHDVRLLPLHRLIPTRLYPGQARTGGDFTNQRYSPRVRLLHRVDWFGGRALLRALSSLGRNPPDVLILQWWTAATLHLYLALALQARRVGVPVVVEFHETQDPGEAGMSGVAWYARRLVPALLHRASGAVVHTRHDLGLLRETFGPGAVDRLAVAMTPHGPYDHFSSTPSPAGPAPADVLAEGPDPATHLLFFGLIRPYKGLEDLIRVFNALPPEDALTFTLTVVGETWQDCDQPAQLIADSPYRDRITFVNRYVPDSEVSGYVRAADVMVLPYRRGSASGPLHVAMSAGMHVVMYAVGGLVEAVEDYPGAHLVDPGDMAGLTRALLDLRPRRRDRFRDPHSWDATVAAHVGLIDLLATG